MVIIAFFAYAIAFLSFAVREILWLRVLAITASAGLIWSELLQPDPRLATITWHPVFIVVNGIWLVRLTWVERRATLSADEELLYTSMFRSFSRLDFRMLLRTGRWSEAAVGDVLATEGKPVDDVSIIVRGGADVTAGGRSIARLGACQMVGEMSFVAGGPASATVAVTEPSRLLVFRKDDLRNLRRRRPSLRFALEAVIGADLSRKLRLRPDAAGRNRDGDAEEA
jgi:CRP-like cAMP-binding protein